MIRFVLNLYGFIIIADAILSYMPQFNHAEWRQAIKKAADVSLEPVRKAMPKDLSIDISHVIVLIVLQIIPQLW